MEEDTVKSFDRLRTPRETQNVKIVTRTRITFHASRITRLSRLINRLNGSYFIIASFGFMKVESKGWSWR